MPVVQTLAAGNNFLTSFNTTVPKLFITAETDDVSEFDQVALRQWRDEGFDVTYIPFVHGGRPYANTLQELPKSMGIGEGYAIIAFGDAAAEALEIFKRPSGKLCALVAYYPSTIPETKTRFPVGMKVVVHLAGESVGLSRTPEVLGLQGKRRTITKAIPTGTGTGGSLRLGYPTYMYENVEPGFAEHDLDEYDRVAASLAWARSLDCLRKAFKSEVDMESVWEDFLERESKNLNISNGKHEQLLTLAVVSLKKKDAAKIMSTMVPRPYVNHVPTLTGGVGREDLKRFYEDFFVPSNPPSLNVKLVSRTIGPDRVVDEMIVSFKHTQEMPWILPGIPATKKDVEVAMVSIVCIRGGRLHHENIYWDQASVLVQLGLLDPKHIPEPFKEQGVKRLPVAGAESARKVLDERSEPSNELIEDW